MRLHTYKDNKFRKENMKTKKKKWKSAARAAAKNGECKMDVSRKKNGREKIGGSKWRLRRGPLAFQVYHSQT
jgi:hypothetical protein